MWLNLYGGGHRENVTIDVFFFTSVVHPLGTALIFRKVLLDFQACLTDGYMETLLDHTT